MAKTQTKTTKKATTKKAKAVETQDTKSTAAKLPKYFYGLGRRKTASATVRLFDTKGISTVNEVAIEEAFIHDYEMQVIMAPFEAAELDPASFHFTTKVKGSGQKAQLDAIKLGIARAIVEMDPSLKTKLKAKGLMTRDPRAVERKKPGLRKARRAEQFSKR